MTDEERRRRKRVVSVQREYEARNKETINARRRVLYHEQNEKKRTQRRAWRSRNLAKARASERASHHRNKDKKAATNKAWRERNREAISARTKKWNEENRDKTHREKMARKYGLTPGEYDAILLSQHGACAICRRQETQRDRRSGLLRRLAVDHDHDTQKIRGLLCGACNAALGHFEDNCERLVAAIAYLRKFTHTVVELQNAI